ncbi:MAG: glycosyltransferase family 2 protein [Phycisphaeraceae bacterium]
MVELVLLVLTIAWGTQAVLSALQVGKFGRLFDKPRREMYEAYRPRAAVIVPFKGRELGLEANVRGLLSQRYDDYRVVMVVESDADPACAVIDAAIAEYGRERAERIVAGRAGPNVGQKVHNQLAALAHLRKADGGEQVWVFADSDAVPGPDWLGDLVGPLGQPHRTAATTGYRWLVPTRHGPASARLCSSLASVMNSSVACMLGHDRSNQAWGGSMALRRDTAAEGELEAHLQGAITDDYVVTRLARRVGRRVYFVPRCLVASPVAMTWRQLVNFGHRQYLITRVYAPGVYAGALFVFAAYVLGMAGTWAAVAWGVAREDWVLVILAGAGLVTVFVANQVRASLRAGMMRKAFDDATVAQLRPAMRLDRWATPVWMTLHLLLILRSGAGRTMTWRGVRYRVDGPQQVERVGGDDPPAPVAGAAGEFATDERG